MKPSWKNSVEYQKWRKKQNKLAKQAEAERINEAKALYEEKGYHFEKPEGWFESATKKIKAEQGEYSLDWNVYKNKDYKSWYVMASADDIEGMDYTEIDKLVYDYRGRVNNYKNKTKESK